MKNLKESDLNRVVNKIKTKKINEGFMDFVTEFYGVIALAVGVKLFGKVVLPKIIEKLFRGVANTHTKELMQRALKLLIDEPETVYIKYKKIKDYYQLSIELKHYNHDTIFDKGVNPLKRIDSGDFPIYMRVYSDDFVNIRGGLGSTNNVEVEGVYDLVESYINNLVSKEDKTLRDQDEYTDIANIFLKHIKSRDTDGFLEELKSTKVNSLIKEISNFTSISEDIVRQALDNVINGYRSVRTKFFTSIMESFYDSLKQLYNKTLEESIKNKIMKKRIVKLNESELEKLVKRVIKEEQEQIKEKQTTLTKHPAYSAIDNLENELEKLKMEFKQSIANAVSGADGYHSEIDKFSEDFGKFITKVSNLKSKINDYQIANKDKEMAEAKERKEKQRQYQHHMREKAKKDGRNYSY